MTSKQPDPEPEAPEVRLEPLLWQPPEVDDLKVVYTASIEDRAAVCTLTVTVARKLYKTEELEGLLNEMKAALVVTEPYSEEDTVDDGEPPSDLDLDNQARFGVEVRLRAPDGTFGATVIVRTAVAKEGDPNAAEVPPAELPGVTAAEALKQDTVLPGLDHWWVAIGGPWTGTATARTNSGTIRKQKAPNPHQVITVGAGGRSEKGKTVWVRGGSKACRYDFEGSFAGPLK